MLLVKVQPPGRILLPSFKCVLCQKHLVRASGSGRDCARCMTTTLIKFTGLPGGRLVPAHTHTRTHTHVLHTHTHTHRDAWMCTCVPANSCTCKTGSHTLQRQTEGGGATELVIRSTQIWYHCNQISDDAEYSISGFGQSSVTFVAEKWHGALVPNAISEVASCTLRTVKNTDTADYLSLDDVHSCNFIYEQREVDISDCSSKAICLLIRANLFHSMRTLSKKKCVSSQREAFSSWFVFTVKRSKMSWLTIISSFLLQNVNISAFYYWQYT